MGNYCQKRRGNPDLNEKERELYLYSTLGCHLCELAEEVVQQAASQLFENRWVFYLTVVDIAEESHLWQPTQNPIPVLVLEGEKGFELMWPFTVEEVIQLIIRQED